MSKQKPRLWRSASDGSKSGERRKYTEFISDNPTRVATVIGAVFSTVLPFIVLIWKSVLCNYGLGTDFSGVCYIILPTVFVGAVVGNGLGRIGQGFSPILGSILAATGGFVVGLFPAGMLLFPDC